MLGPIDRLDPKEDTICPILSYPDAMDGLTARLFALVDTLQGAGLQTVAELADRLGVSERTVRRDIDRLQALDVAVVTARGRGGGVRLEPGALLLPLRFSDDEVLALGLGLELVARSGELIPAEVIGSATRRLGAAVTPTLQRRLGALLGVLEERNDGDEAKPERTAVPPTGERSTLILDLAEAIEARRTIRLGYRSRQGAISERTVEPHGLVRLAPHWYLAGRCRLRDGVRVFRLDRVRFARPQDERFNRPGDADPNAAVARALAHPLHSDAIRIEAILHTDLETAGGLDLPLAALLEREGEGVRITVPGRPASLGRVALHLLALPFPVTVLGPEGLREVLAKVGERALGLAG
jgi:predicted DNA-binding transcriptional regulator YafY